MRTKVSCHTYKKIYGERNNKSLLHGICMQDTFARARATIGILYTSMGFVNCNLLSRAKTFFCDFQNELISL